MGEWTTSLELEPGAYRFRYLVDGRQWLTDYAAFGLIRNRLGEWDSVIYVPLPRVIHPTPKSMDNVPLDMPADSNDELIDTDGWARAIRKVGMGI